MKLQYRDNQLTEVVHFDSESIITNQVAFAEFVTSTADQTTFWAAEVDRGIYDLLVSFGSLTPIVMDIVKPIDDEELRAAAEEYQDMQQSSRCDSTDGRAALKSLMNMMEYRGLEFSTLNLARLGHNIYLNYLEGGMIEGHDVVEGDIVAVV